MIKFLQINTYKGKYIDELIEYINKLSPDFISMNEVTKGKVNLSKTDADLFEVYKKSLSMYGVREFDFEIAKNEGSFGNAVFSKFPINDSEVVRLKSAEVWEKYIDDPKRFEQYPRHILAADVEFEGRLIKALSWHGTWTAPPHDTEETKRQADIACLYLDKLNNADVPFILGCDLNAISSSYTVQEVEKRAVNLMRALDVNMTTHPVVHKIAPRGYAVDYIFTSKHFKMLKVEVSVVTVADHLPVYAELEFIA